MVKQIPRLIAKTLFRACLFAVWLWGALALFYFPAVPRWVGLVLAAAFAMGTVSLFWWYENRQRSFQYTCVAVLCIFVAWINIEPTQRRSWSRLQAKMATAEIQPDHVTIHNLRRTTYDEHGHSVEHYDQSFDLNQLESVWFGVQHLAFWNAVAHTFVSFGFSDGNYLAISVESRRQEGEAFSPIAGLFKRYGMIYVMGDEREVIGQRSLQQEDPIYLYPIKANKQQLRDMLLTMLHRANRLSERPEFYNSLTNNCTNSIVDSFNEIAPIRLFRYSPRIVFPGYSGKTAYAHGLLDTELSFAEIKKRAHINDAARAAANGSDFSQRIRKQMTAGGTVTD